ncbi:hypothetical protein Hanom_Chr00s002080g01691601 [Helianthus anomalus]
MYVMRVPPSLASASGSYRFCALASFKTKSTRGFVIQRATSLLDSGAKYRRPIKIDPRPIKSLE